MAKIEKLFGSGDLFGIEVSIESLGSGEIVVYSDELTPEQRERIEEALGEVTYQPPWAGRQLDGGSDCYLVETHLDKATTSECPKQEIIRRLGG